MDVGALAPYEHALRAGGPLGIHTPDGRFVELEVARWLAGVDPADGTVLQRCVAPVLDVGCGPGRFVSALHARGMAALGVDIADAAVAITREQGLPALLRSVFADLPGEGRWPTALLMDGNIGIGGDPLRLLRRLGTVTAGAGRIIVEAHPEPDRYAVMDVRFSSGGRPVGPEFSWAEVGLDAIARVAHAAGLGVGETWRVRGRQFATLTPAG